MQRIDAIVLVKNITIYYRLYSLKINSEIYLKRISKHEQELINCWLGCSTEVVTTSSSSSSSSSAPPLTTDEAIRSEDSTTAIGGRRLMPFDDVWCSFSDSFFTMTSCHLEIFTYNYLITNKKIHLFNNSVKRYLLKCPRRYRSRPDTNNNNIT